MSYDKEIKLAEKLARRSCPVAFGLWDVLVVLETSLVHTDDQARRAASHMALREIGEIVAAANRDAFEGFRPRPDITDQDAESVLARVGLLREPDLVTICGDCMREHVGECAAQRRSNLRRERATA